jgi:hypothetical protein
MNIGDVFFQLRGDGSGLAVDAKKAAEAAGATGATSFSASFNAKLKGLGAAGGVAGFGVAAGMAAWNALGTSISGVVDFMGDAVNAAMEDEASQAKLRTALEANVKGWDGNTAAIEKVLTSRMKLGFSDDEQRASLAVLVARTGDVTKALDIQRAAMDLARLKGIDLAAASKAIAMGMSGSGKALKELGINVKDYANANEILSAIQAKAAGQAEAYGNTTAGAMAEMRVAIDEATEAIGYKLLPIVKDLAIFARDNAVPAVDGLMDALGRVGQGASNIQKVRDTLADKVTWTVGMIVDPSGTATRETYKYELAQIAASKAAADAALKTAALAQAQKDGTLANVGMGAALADARQKVADYAAATERTTAWAIKARDVLPGLATAFRATAAAARISRLDTAWGIKELPDQIIVAKEAVRQAGKDVTAADKDVAAARVALAHATTRTQKAAAQDALTAALAAAAASRIALDGTKQQVDDFQQKLDDSQAEFGASGEMLGKMLGSGLYRQVVAWNALTRAQLATLGQVWIDPHFKLPSTKAAPHAGAQAAGGPYTAGQIDWVGEKGPELRVAASPGYTLTHQEALTIAKGAQGGGGNTYQITVNNPEPRPAPEDIRRVLRRAAALGMT